MSYVGSGRIIPSHQDAEITIAVMGATGTGKSTFINQVSGSNMEVSAGLRSCTTTVNQSKIFDVQGTLVKLIDTPGFDDTTVSDSDILKLIASYFAGELEQGRQLSGVIYMHRISDVRMGGTARKNFNMFKKLCGEGFLKNVIIVTNMWSDVSPGVGEAREQELRTDKMLFKPVLDAGARMLRHDGTKASAQDILQQFLFNPPLPLRIQQELIIEKKAITETAACEELDRELEGLKKRQEEELRDLRQQFEEAKRDRDNQAMEELDLSRREVEEKLRSLTDRREKLSEEYTDIRSQPRDEISELQGAIAAAKRSEADLRKLFKEAEEGYLREIRHLHEEVQQVKSDSKRRLKDLVVKHIAELNSQADRLAPWRIGSRTRERNEGLEWEQTVREIREMENSKRKAEMSEGYQDSRKKHHLAIEEAPLPGCIALGGYLARQDGKKYEKQEESGCRKEMKRKHLGKRRLHSTSHLSPIAEIGADWVLTEDSAR